jgi:propanediol dehydratase small subunit
VAFNPRSDYPLGSRRPDLVETPGGLALDSVTLDGLRAGKLSGDDVRATPETLRRQADIARAAGREQLAANLERAAELATIPAEVILEAYTALRPHRSTADELDGFAERLEREYGAPRCAEFVREARAAYVERGLLRSVESAAI